MVLKCQNPECGREFDRHDVQFAVEHGEIDEVVKHIVDPDDALVQSETRYYCDLECAAEHVSGEG